MAMAVPAGAEKPAWAGNANAGKHGHPGVKGNKGNSGQHVAGRANKNKNAGRQWNKQAANHHAGTGNYPPHNFDSRQRAIIHDYFAPRFQSGRCPTGLAKKYNGCMPPGQAKKWAIGYPLPRNAIFYDLPPALARTIGPARTRIPICTRRRRYPSDCCRHRYGIGRSGRSKLHVSHTGIPFAECFALRSGRCAAKCIVRAH